MNGRDICRPFYLNFFLWFLSRFWLFYVCSILSGGDNNTSSRDKVCIPSHCTVVYSTWPLRCSHRRPLSLYWVPLRTPTLRTRPPPGRGCLRSLTKDIRGQLVSSVSDISKRPSQDSHPAQSLLYQTQAQDREESQWRLLRRFHNHTPNLWPSESWKAQDTASSKKPEA